MGKRKKPKFAVGNSVVVLVNGIIGVVTSVQEFNQTFVYEVQGAEGAFTESSLISVEEFEGLLFDAEHVNIDYRFFFGDLVQVKGYGKDIFKVIGFRTEIWRYKEESWEDVIYELSRVSDEEWLECAEEDLILLADANEAEAYIQKHLKQNMPKPKQKATQADKVITSHVKYQGAADIDRKQQAMINHLLDIYNDYRILYELFKDESYTKVMKTAIKKLKKLVTTQHKPKNNDPR